MRRLGELVLTVGAPALVLSLLLPFVLKPLLERWGVVDIPNERSSHHRTVIRGMGLAVAAAVLVGDGLALLTGTIRVDRSVALVVLAVAALSAALGWAEDYRGVSVRGRLAAQLGLGLAATAVLVTVLGTSVWWLPVGALAIAAYINMANFMDGINGISGLHGLTAGLLYAWAGASNDLPWMIAAGLAVAGGFVGFLPWNLGRGTVFLGDVGSYLLGGSLAAIAVAAFLSGVYVEYLLPPLAVYVADTAVTLVRRIRAGEVWYRPHRQHVYQRLTDVGLSHVGSALVVSGATVLVSAASVLGLRTGPLATALAGAFVVAVLVLYLVLPELLGRRAAARTRDGARP
ncbi:glycosyltransferase family 4 protein [Kocuria rosea]|uniref:MraY family glycosyltransferase n=1 Tax=Kocuria rosea TaxID=1275 RepID=UPI0020418E21|nr:glycosyltransferase family 4 protein [Kocuria rosea]